VNRTKIEWVVNPDGSPGFSWNPIVGCTNGCSYCYARRQARRQKRNCQLCYDFVPHLHEERLDQPLKRKESATIFLGSMCDLWDPMVDPVWRMDIWHIINATPRHTYLVLTKQPQHVTWPLCNNLWIGVSVTRMSQLHFIRDLVYGREPMAWGPEDKPMFVSFEPLLERLHLGDHHRVSAMSWAIVGAQTGPTVQPGISALADLLGSLRRANVPIFAKDNLDWYEHFQPRPRRLPYLPPGSPQSSQEE